ncbi:MAG: site-specific integrase [Candidatus Thiodiazotropha sp. (ex Lucinoma borealis)]|nr:site-specific integrase [Candidatus Thiodiazotropha sp. (ex Lucinoma borealis)]
MAQRWAQETERSMERMEWNDPELLKKTTLAELIAQYKEEVGAIKALHSTKERSLRYISESIGNRTLAELRPADVIAYGRKRQKKVSPSTITVEVRYLAEVLRTARAMWSLPITDQVVKDALIIMNQQEMTGQSQERDRRPTEAELAKLRAYWVNTPRETPMCDLMDFAIASCMRLGEICRIRWDDIDVTDKTIVIRDRKDPRKKKGNHQIVPLLGDAWDIVQRQPQIDKRVFPYRPATVSQLWWRIAKLLDIHDLRFHDLRHEGISRLFEQGYQIQEVALVSGHKKWDHLRRYTQLKAGDLHRG